MTTAFDELKANLQQRPRKWLVTGAAGFIGSHIVEMLLSLDQVVVGLDNFSTGLRSNLCEVESRVKPQQWMRFRFCEGDVSRSIDCIAACAGVEIVLHQAALGSVPRSLGDPLCTHKNNVDGFITLLEAVRSAGIDRFVYASSSSVYGDNLQLPKVESSIGNPLSPYAATKLIDEIYAGVYSKCFGLSTIGLRYFNVFGPRQDPNGAYAAVIPKWFAAISRGVSVQINGDGETSRDFCYIANVVQANLLAGINCRSNSLNQVYNIAVGQRISLNLLFGKIRDQVAERIPSVRGLAPAYTFERFGDVRHSLADISLAKAQLGYEPTHSLDDGLRETNAWYCQSDFLQK